MLDWKTFQTALVLGNCNGIYRFKLLEFLLYPTGLFSYENERKKQKPPSKCLENLR